MAENKILRESID
jgi:hypothetical protein